MKRKWYLSIVLLCLVFFMCTACQKKESELEEKALSKILIQSEETEEIESIEQEKTNEVIEHIHEMADTVETKENTVIEDSIASENNNETIGTDEQAEDSKQITRIVGADTSQVGTHETENMYYAIYPSVLTENGPNNKPEQFYVWDKKIDITFPQIYYSNEYKEYSSLVETEINHVLFMQSLGNDDSFIFGRDSRLLQGCETDYEITKADDELVSIKYSEQIWDVYHSNSLCYGITIDIKTGKKIALSEFITLEDNLRAQVENGEIEYISSWHEWEDVKSDVEAFEELYKNENVDMYSCYYVEKDAINLIVKLAQGNGSYIILRIPVK